MKRTVRAVVLAVAVMAMVVPAVSADGDWGVARQRTFNCDGKPLLVILPPSEFTTPAIVPFHVVGSGSVLVPFVFTVDGTTYVSKPFAARHGDRVLHCDYTDGYGYHIEITGLLTPAR